MIFWNRCKSYWWCFPRISSTWWKHPPLHNEHNEANFLVVIVKSIIAYHNWMILRAPMQDLVWPCWISADRTTACSIRYLVWCWNLDPPLDTDPWCRHDVVRLLDLIAVNDFHCTTGCCEQCAGIGTLSLCKQNWTIILIFLSCRCICEMHIRETRIRCMWSYFLFLLNHWLSRTWIGYAFGVREENGSDTHWCSHACWPTHDWRLFRKKVDIFDVC